MSCHCGVNHPTKARPIPKIIPRIFDIFIAYLMDTSSNRSGVAGKICVANWDYSHIVRLFQILRFHMLFDECDLGYYAHILNCNLLSVSA